MSTPKNILVPTDFTACSTLAVERTFALADKLGAKVHLLHVYSIEGMPDDTMLLLGAREIEADAVRKLYALAEGAGPKAGQLLARLGDPARTIVEVAEELGADAIMMGTHGRRGFARMFLGSVAAAVLRTARCTVMVVRSTETAPAQKAS